MNEWQWAVSPALRKLQASASKTSSKAEAQEAIKTSRWNELNTSEETTGVC